MIEPNPHAILLGEMKLKSVSSTDSVHILIGPQHYLFVPDVTCEARHFTLSVYIYIIYT